MTKDVGEMKDEELEKVAGGDGRRDRMVPPTSILTTTKPHCKSCGKVLPLIEGAYVCDTVGCKEMGVRKGSTEVAWY